MCYLRFASYIQIFDVKVVFIYFQVKEETKAPDPEERFLKQLGFHVGEPRLYPKNKWLNVTLPVFVTAVIPSESHFVFGFLKSFQHFFPNSFLIIYDLGLNPSDYVLVSIFHLY